MSRTVAKLSITPKCRLQAHALPADEEDMADQVDVPQEWVGQNVYVQLRVMIQDPKRGQAGFPGVHGRLEAVTGCGVIVRTSDESIMGPPGKLWLPLSVFQCVNLCSDITVPRVQLS